MNAGDTSELSPRRALTGVPNGEAIAGFLEIVFDAAIAFDTRERITYWNPAAEQMYGWTAQEALGKTPAKLFWRVDTPEEKKSRRQRQSRLKRGEILRGEHEACRRDGSFLQVQYVTRAVFDAEGKLHGYLAIYRDISDQERDTTERKQYEESLRARTEEIEALLQVSPVAIFVAHDPQCARITGNPAAYRLVGLSENTDANISKSAPAQERPTYRVFRNGVEVLAQDLPMQKAARLGAEVNEEALELRFEDGSQRSVYVFAKPLFDSQGKSRGAIAAMLDITDRKRTEQQLERSNQWLYRILDSIQDDLFVIDRDWKFVFTSRSFTSKLGKKPRELIGQNVWETFTRHIGTALEENFRAAMEQGEIRRFEIPEQYTSAWYQITAFPSTDGITVLGTDVSGLKRSEQLIKENEEKFRNVFDQSPIGIGVYNADGMLVDSNRAAMEMFGISSLEKMVGLNLFGSPTVREEAKRQLRHQEQIREEVVYDFDEIRRLGFYETTRSGISYFDRIITPLRSTPTDEPLGYLSQVLDITERKRLELETESMAKFPRENPNPVLRVSQAGVVLFGNRASQKLLEAWNCSIGAPLPDPWRAEVAERFRLGLPGEAMLEAHGRIFSLHLVPVVESHYLNIYGRDITERKHAEDALRASEERLRQMIETSPVAIGFGDSTGKIFDANTAFYRLTGYSREEIRAKQLGWNQLTAPEYAELDRQMMATLDASGSAGPYEKEYSRKDGSRIPLMITLSKLPGRDEHIAFIMDISARKRTEQALAQALQELYAHLNNSPLAVVSFNSEYRITEWSQGAERMFGWHAEEVLNKAIPELRWVHEEDVQRVADLSADMLAGRASSNVHANRNYRRDGSVIECEWYNSALLDPNGKLVSVRSQVLDVTERKRAQETLARQSELLQKVFENIPVLLVMWDPRLHRFTLNRHAETVLGWTISDANSGDFMSMVYPDPDYRAEVSAYMQSLASGFRELLTAAKDGERIPIEWANIKLADDTMIGIGVDLREYKRAEAALRENQQQLERLNETLEQQVQEKTAEVRHLASELVKAVQRERHRLSHILHDDLQQRVYAIRMQLTFLRDHVPSENETAQSDVADIETQLDEILMVTRSLSVDLSPPILRDEGLAHAISWLAARMRQRYGLPIELQANGPFAIANEELHVLLFNCVRELLFNVVKHAEASRAVVGLHWTDSGLQIEVRDDGKGFSAGATGLQDDGVMSEEDSSHASSGLPTIRYQLSLFGGHMEIQSEPGAGARITLSIPVPEGG